MSVMRRGFLFNFLNINNYNFLNLKRSSTNIQFCSKGYKMNEDQVRVYEIDEENNTKIELEVQEIGVNKREETFKFLFSLDDYSIFFKDYYIQIKLYMMWVLYNTDYEQDFIENWRGKHSNKLHKGLRLGFFKDFVSSVSNVTFIEKYNSPTFLSSYFCNRYPSLNNFFVCQQLMSCYDSFLASGAKLFNKGFLDDNEFYDFMYKYGLPIRTVKIWINSFKDLRVKHHKFYKYTPNKLYICSKSYNINIIKSFYYHCVKFGLSSIFSYRLNYIRGFKEEYGLEVNSDNIFKGVYSSIMCCNTFYVRSKLFSMRSKNLKGAVKINNIEDFINSDTITDPNQLEWIKSDYMWSTRRLGPDNKEYLELDNLDGDFEDKVNEDDDKY